MLFFVAYKKDTLMKVAYFFNIYYHTSFQSPILNVAPTSEVRVSAILLLLIVRN